MSLALSQVSVTGTATQLCVVEPGQTALLASTTSTAVGTANTVTTSGATGGFLLPTSGVPVPFTVPDVQGAASITLWGITASASVVSVALAGNP